mmetsp:Transcript_78497/g.221929  ORF Transcript_78497/g.221929 Transcript_78497/m.221929 type:complete len:143 (+) Transcript_78497:403-831(+)
MPPLPKRIPAPAFEGEHHRTRKKTNGIHAGLTQPLPSFLQQYAFFSGVQAFFQFANAALQSCGGHVVVAPAAGGGQPFPPWLQHQACLPSLQPFCQLLNPALQSKGREVVAGTGAAVVGQPRPPCEQQNARLATDQRATRQW